MENLQTQIRNSLNDALRTKKTDETSVLRMLIASLKNKEIEMKNRDQADLPDEVVISVIQSEIKKRRDSAAAYAGGNRNDLADKERMEIKTLERYLPEQLSDERIETIVTEISAALENPSPAEFGKVMGAVMAKVKGRADGNRVSAIVKRILSE